MISLAAIIDFWFCPELEARQKEKYVRNIEIRLHEDQFYKRKKRYEAYLRLQKELAPPKNKRKKGKTKQSIWHRFLKVRYKWLEKRLHPLYLLNEERKVNPKLTLIDFEQKSLKIYSDLSQHIKYEKGNIVITIDHSDQPLPSYEPYIRYPDMIKLAVLMHLVHLHFFTDKIIGMVKYKNKTPKSIKWLDTQPKEKKKNAINPKLKTVLSKTRNFAERLQRSSERTPPVFPFRCVHCKLKNSCEKVSVFPSLVTKTKKKEAIEKTFKDFQQAKDTLLSTYWEHWRHDVKKLVDIIHDSPTIKQHIDNNLTDEMFDIEEMVLSSALNQKGLYNSYIETKKPKTRFTLAYQLLFYLAKNPKRTDMKMLLGSYGWTDNYDRKTSSDEKIKNFFNKTCQHFLQSIETHLSKQLPNKTINQFHNRGGQMIITNDKSRVKATMTIYKEPENEDDDKQREKNEEC